MSKQVKIVILILLILALAGLYAYTDAQHDDAYEQTNQMFEKTNQAMTIDALSQ
jgi:Tfp pilus assembly protein PilV